MSTSVISDVANYQAYSTVFSSPFELAGFTSTKADADVGIKFGPVQQELGNPLTIGPIWAANRSEMLLSAPEVGRYYAANGTSITIDAPAETARLITVLAGIPIASILMQRGFLALHAAAFDHPELGTIAICGENGAGKSSLAMAMIKAGATRICDNLGAVTVDPNTADHILHQGPSSFRLWGHSAREFELDTSDAQQVSEDMDKYVFTEPASVHERGPTPLRGIVCLQQHDQSQPRVDRLDDLSATASVAEHHFRNDLARVMIPTWLDRISQLARQVPVYQLWRPVDGCPPDRLAAFLTAELASLVHN